MASVGITLTGNENISSEVAPRAVEGLKRVEEQARRTSQALGGDGGTGGAGGSGGAGPGFYGGPPAPIYGAGGPSGADWSPVRDQMSEWANEAQRDADKDKRANLGRLVSASRSAPGIINQAGQGEGLGAGSDILSQTGGLLTSLGFTGVGLGALAVGAGGMAVNALSGQYERTLPSRLQLAAMQGNLGGGLSENTAALEATLRSAAEAANSFGYTLEEGIVVQKQYAEVVGELSDEQIQARSGEAFAFGRGYGMDSNTLAAAQARGMRFGQGDILGFTGGALEAQGLGAGRYGEQLSAMQTIFEEALSRGVVRGFEDVSSTMATFGQLGEVFRGAEGAERIASLSADVAGATGMQREQDVLLYRAARSLGREDEDYITTLQRMEEGMTPQLLEAFAQEASSITGGNQTDMIALFQSTFSGLNYTLAEQVVDLVQRGDFIRGAERIGAAPSAASRDLDLLTAQTSLQTTMADLGSDVVELKLATIQAADSFLTGTDNLISALGNPAGAGGLDRTRQAIADADTLYDMDFREAEDYIKPGFGSGGNARARAEISSYKDIVGLASRAAGGGGAYAEAGQGIMDLLGGAGIEQVQALQATGTFRETYMGASGDGGVLHNDLPNILSELTKAINEMNTGSITTTVISEAAPVGSRYGRGGVE